MSFELTNTDYKKILQYYKLDIPKNKNRIKQNKLIKKSAENILSQKLCSCIKKVNPVQPDNPNAIGSCVRSVLNLKGIKNTNFTCKKKRTISLKKLNRTLSIKLKNNIKKTRRNI